ISPIIGTVLILAIMVSITGTMLAWGIPQIQESEAYAIYTSGQLEFNQGDPWDVRIWGDQAIVEDNTFQNGTGGFILHGNFTKVASNIFKDYYYRGGSSVLTFGNASTNSTLSNNLFTNLTSIHALRLHTSDDNLINNNTFTSAGVYWHTVVDRSGFRNNYNNNTFEKCAGDFRNETPWYQTCLIFFFWSYPDDHYGGEHLIENNSFENYEILFA
ncbi:MAG: hypothetical protein ACJZ37_01280, partial [Candidatus Poseidoniales archaeon]